MESDKNEKEDVELTEFFSEVKGLFPDELYDSFFKTMQTGRDSRNALFKAAGVDKDFVNKLQQEFLKEDSDLTSICNLIAPELRKIFGVEVDSKAENPSGAPHFKKSGHNLFDEIGMDNERLSELLATFVKCYRNDTDEDWHHLSQIMLKYFDKFFAPAYKKAEMAGLLESDPVNKEKIGGKR